MTQWNHSHVDLAGESVISPELIRSHFRESAGNDEYLMFVVRGAVYTVEIDSRLAIFPAIYTADLAASAVSVALPRGPFVSAELFAVDDEDAETALPDVVINHAGNTSGCLTWDAVTGDHSALRVRYRAGQFPLREDVAIVVLELALHRHEHREAATADGVVKTVPLGYHHAVRGLDPMQDAVR